MRKLALLPLALLAFSTTALARPGPILVHAIAFSVSSSDGAPIAGVRLGAGLSADERKWNPIWAHPWLLPIAALVCAEARPTPDIPHAWANCIGLVTHTIIWIKSSWAETDASGRGLLPAQGAPAPEGILGWKPVLEIEPLAWLRPFEFQSALTPARGYKCSIEFWQHTGCENVHLRGQKAVNTLAESGLRCTLPKTAAELQELGQASLLKCRDSLVHFEATTGTSYPSEIVTPY